MADYWNDGTELYHHGILGQKWGVRNGPPYPLDDEDHNAAERKAGWKKSLDSGDNKTNTNRKNKKDPEYNTKLAKKLITAGAIAVAGYLTYRYVTDPHKLPRKLAVALKEYFKDLDMDPDEFDAKITDELGKLEYSAYTDEFLADFSKNHSVDTPFDELYGTSDVYERMFDSPGWNQSAVQALLDGNNPGFMLSSDTNMNCRMCTTSLVMRLKGYDTCANISHCGFSDQMLGKIWDGSETISRQWKSAESILESMKARGDNTYGDVSVRWKCGGGHSIMYAVKDGVVRFIDGQAGREYNTDELMDAIDWSRLTYTDLTHATPKPVINGMLLSRSERAVARPKTTDLMSFIQKLAVKLAAKTSGDSEQEIVGRILDEDKRFLKWQEEPPNLDKLLAELRLHL